MKHIFVGGTFDRFHVGHEAVLRKAFEVGDKITIGITTQTYLDTYKPLAVGGVQRQSFEERKREIEHYIDGLHTSKEVVFLPIDDPYEPLASDAMYDSVVVTKDNIQTALEINIRRQQQNISILQLVEVPIIPAQDHQILSSSRIRQNHIDRYGKLLLPEHLRGALREPFGKIFTQQDYDLVFQKKEGSLFITVGDLTTWNAFKRGIVPDLAVIDLQVERKPFKTIEEFPIPQSMMVKEIASGPGFIAKEIWGTLETWLQGKEQVLLLIKGEDDLLVLPLILVCPEHSIILYGQPGEGVVRVEVSRELKETGKQLIEQFENKE